MQNDDVSVSGSLPDTDPRPVSRGSKLQPVFIGIDSLYLVIEYQDRDVYDYWNEPVKGVREENRIEKLREGIPYHGMLLRTGGLGYQLSVWDGDARLFLTHRVNDVLKNTPSEGQGMGIMLQLGPKWLRAYADAGPKSFRENLLSQLISFGISESDQYPMRINRLDIAIDILGLSVASFSADEWRENWIGYASPSSFHVSDKTRQLEGLTVGSSSGAVRFKIYDKVAESEKRGTSRFWRSVWGIEEQETVEVARFEWSIKCYKARFAEMRYFSEFTYTKLLELLNYASLKWGRLCIPQPTVNQSRWPLAPIWKELRAIIEDYTFSYNVAAHREYDYRVDLNEAYLKSVAGWLAGLLVRVGLEFNGEKPVTLPDGMGFLKDTGYPDSYISRKANKKWAVASRLAGKGMSS